MRTRPATASETNGRPSSKTMICCFVRQQLRRRGRTTRRGERYQRTIPINGDPAPVTDQLFWAGIASLTGLPASVAPIGLAENGLPVGVQIIGAEYGDLTCIGFARMLEREYYAFVPPPGYS